MCFGIQAWSCFDVDDRVLTPKGLAYPPGMRLLLMFNDGLYYSMHDRQIPHARVEGCCEKEIKNPFVRDLGEARQLWFTYVEVSLRT
jgi:hypothetical protein